MNATRINAPRPTAASIARFFWLSGKRHLLLTASRGRGKTTLLAALLPMLQSGPMPGVTTWARPGQGVWLREEGSGQTTQIGVFDPGLPGEENRMRPLPQGFASLALPALERGKTARSPWFSIDEIGYLEGSCPAYCRGIWELMDCKRLVAVLRKQDTPFLSALRAREDVCLIDLDRPLAELGCVIMASGLGTRFGGNKLMAPFGEKPLVAWALEATKEVFPRRVVVTRHRDVAEFCRSQGVETVLHDLPGRNDTVRLGLEALGNGLAGCMFCPGDQPLLHRDSVLTLALAATHFPQLIWQLAWDGVPGAPALFPAWAFGPLRQLPQGKGGGVLLKKYAEQVRLVPAQQAHECMDVDRREDLARLAASALE